MTGQVRYGKGYRLQTRLEMISLRSFWSRIDKFLAAILLTVAFAAVMPARGDAAAAGCWLGGTALVLFVFYARGEAFARRGARRSAALAAARDGVPGHIRAVSVARNVRALPRPDFPPRAALGR